MTLLIAFMFGLLSWAVGSIIYSQGKVDDLTRDVEHLKEATVSLRCHINNLIDDVSFLKINSRN